MLSIVEHDYGTPERVSAKLVTLSIDGREVTVPEGTSVMRAAALSDVKIPKLCATELLEAFGSCRMCLVQIEGMKGLPASCTTPGASPSRGSQVHSAPMPWMTTALMATAGSAPAWRARCRT